MRHNRATTGHEVPLACPGSVAIRDPGGGMRGCGCPNCPINLNRAAPMDKTTPIEFTSDDRVSTGSSNSLTTSNTRHEVRATLTSYAKTIERYTGPPGPFALGLFCALFIWLSYRSNDLAKQALVESRKQTALAEWSARLAFVQYCNTLPPENTSTIQLCDSTFEQELTPPPTLDDEDRPKQFYSMAQAPTKRPPLRGGGSLHDWMRSIGATTSIGRPK